MISNAKLSNRSGTPVSVSPDLSSCASLSRRFVVWRGTVIWPLSIKPSTSPHSLRLFSNAVPKKRWSCLRKFLLILSTGIEKPLSDISLWKRTSFLGFRQIRDNHMDLPTFCAKRALRRKRKGKAIPSQAEWEVGRSVSGKEMSSSYDNPYVGQKEKVLQVQGCPFFPDCPFCFHCWF